MFGTFPHFGFFDFMSRYFFHTEDGTICTDHQGVELPDLRAARIEAAKSVGQIVHDKPDEFWDDGSFKMTVTDESGLVLFMLDLSATDAPALASSRQG